MSNRILPALVTPLTADGQLDTASAEKLIEHLYQVGCGGLYVTGSTGEGVYLDFETRRRIVEIAVSMSQGRGEVIVHVGAVQAGQAFELAAHAGKVKADGVSSIPPFLGGYSWSEVVGYYRRLAQVSPVPVVGYYIPVLTGTHWSIDQLAEIVSIDNVSGLKFTATDMYVMQRLLVRMRPQQVLFHGADEMLALGLAMGAHGGIGTTYNFMPQLILKVAEQSRAGRWAEAFITQKQVCEVIEILLRYNGLAATKQILYWQGLIATPTCAPPRAGLTAEQQQTLRSALEKTPIGATLVR